MSTNMENINYKDFENICRTCMSYCDTKFLQDSVISKVFFKLTDMHFETNDGLPEQICLKCFKKINEIHDFAFQCKRTHSNLTKCLNNIKSKRLNEEEEINAVINTKDEITIDEHEIDFVKEELNLINTYVVDKFELKSEIEEPETNNELNKSSEINEQNINYCEDDLLISNTPIIKTENKTETTDNANQKDFRENNKIELNTNNEKNYKSDVQMHTHSGERPYKCDQCSKSFYEMAHLKRHMRIHSGERPFKCDQCSKSFSDSSTLKKHLRTHSGERPYKCDQCLKSFIQLIHLQKHSRTHSGERPSKCHQCAKSFSDSTTLKKHLRTHSGERPYKCDQCARSFSDSSTLKKHLLTHSGERLYKCDQCPKSFILLAHLKKHLRTHSGERPYKCDQCLKSFIQSTHLKRHLRTHSGERPNNCDDA